MLSNTAVPYEYGAFREQVLNGEIPVCREVELEMNRIDRLIDDPRYYYDDAAIDGFIMFCENELTLTNGEPVKLLPSFKLWAECALAWYEYVDTIIYDYDRRDYRKVTRKQRLVNKQYLIVGRGAAKSMYASFIQAYALVVDKTTTHQIVVAPTMDLAQETMSPIETAIATARGPLFKYMTQGSIKSNTWSKVQLASTKKGVQNFATGSLLEVRPMSIRKLQGARSTYNTVDEWLSGDIKEDVIEALEQGASKNFAEYLIVATSSEGNSRDGVGDSIKLHLKDILEGTVYDPHTSIWHYKLDDVKEVNQPDMWLKANPNIGATVSYETYENAVHTMETDPTKRNDILAKRFGIPVAGFTYYFTYEETIPYNKQDFTGMLCALGADMSQGDDFCAFTFLFPLPDGRFGVKTRSYVSDSKIRRVPKATKLRYDDFIREGTLVVMDKDILDTEEVYEDLSAYIEDNDYDVRAFGYDPYNARPFVEHWNKDNGDYGVEKVIQGAKTESVPMGELKNLSEGKSLIFDEKLMQFAMGNAIAIQDSNGNLKLSKRRSFEKIDNVAALIDAWVAYKRNQEEFE